MIEWFLHVNSDGILFYSTLYLWHLNPGRGGGGGAPQLPFVRFFRKKSLFFINFKNFVIDFCWDLKNKNRYCLEFDLTDSDFEFTTIFWISITELFVAMNSVTERNINNGFIYNDLWHSNNMNVILPNFCSGSLFFNSLNFELCWLYSFFLYWLFPYGSQSSQIV